MTRLKVCGVTRLDDAELAAELGAWAVGLIFWPASPRRCDPATGAAIARALKRRVEVAGVFVNAALDRVALLSDTVGLTLVQLHGDEGPAYCGEVARRTGARVIKAARVRTAADLQALRTFHTDFHLLDAGHGDARGGTGRTWDWSLAAGHDPVAPVLLSGGLTPDNVAEAVAQVGPWGVDVASGVEAAPGIKDPERLREFAAALAAAPAPA